MNTAPVEVWDIEYSIDTKATAQALWKVMSDMRRWSEWNAGVEWSATDGPFAAGTEYLMKTPGLAPLHGRLLEVVENAGFVDETQVGATRVLVDHRIECLGSERCRVVFTLEAFGPDCDEIGSAASADFPDVLAALVRRAEQT